MIGRSIGRRQARRLGGVKPAPSDDAAESIRGAMNQPASQPTRPVGDQSNSAQANRPGLGLQMDGPADASDPSLTAEQREQVKVDPINTQVDAETETVESRLNNLTDSNSRYIQQARRDAMRSANSRGLINSSIAAGAGEEAAIRSALPIAQQDAQTYTDTRMENQRTNNQFLENYANTEFNKEISRLDSSLKMAEMELDNDLRIRFERVLADEKFNNDYKKSIIDQMNTIVTNATADIAEVGLSDMSAKAQAAATVQIEKRRDAELRTYEKLLQGFDGFRWNSNFAFESFGSRTLANIKQKEAAEAAAAARRRRTASQNQGGGDRDGPGRGPAASQGGRFGFASTPGRGTRSGPGGSGPGRGGVGGPPGGSGRGGAPSGSAAGGI